MPTIDNAIFARCLQAFQEHLFDSGFTLLLASSDYDLTREHREVQALVERGIDGLLLIGEARDPEVYKLLEAKQVPCINSWVYAARGPHPCVGFDNEQAAYQLTSYLLDIGHEVIAMVAGITDGNDRALLRARGVRRALNERGMDFLPGHYGEWAYEISEGRKATNFLLASPRRPTAVVCGNDVLARGVLFECQAQGLKVPGADVHHRLRRSGPGRPVGSCLTTVHIPSSEMGRQAAEHLISRLHDKPVVDKTRLDFSLIIRDSTAPPACAS